MISELFFIKTYNSFWNQLLNSAEDYIKSINAAGLEEVSEVIRDDDQPSRRILVNNVATRIFQLGIEKNILPSLLVSDNKIDLELVSEEQKERLLNLRFGSKLSSTLKSVEKGILLKMADGLFSHYFDKGNLQLNPRFNGCGMLFPSNGDLIYDRTLVEIKAGERNFKSIDLRQLYTYMAVSYADTKTIYDKIELFNPRNGVVWTEEVDEVSNSISGYSTIELLDEIIKFLINGMEVEVKQSH
ncbi:MAG: hypothetical protein JXR07_07730 [Reichenbachiella sp.]